MNGAAILTMVLICGFIWGGLACLLTLALRRESAKEHDGSGGDETS